MRKIIIDCDPGQDDAAALMMAFAMPEALDILGITVVAGNVPLHLTHVNARKICELTGRRDLKVYAGCARPMVKGLHTAENIHGVTGMDGADLPEPTMPLEKEHAVHFIIRTLRESREPITLAPTGPLTNIAMALVMAPDIKKNIQEIVLMGGARDLGNVTPAAEFNFFVDPHAAHVVMTSGLKITMLGLDVTHKALATHEWVAEMRAIGTRVATTFGNVLDIHVRFDKERYHTTGGPIHDPTVIGYLVRPDLFSGKDCFVEIDIYSPLSMGMSLVDWYGYAGKTPNVFVIDHLDAPAFFAWTKELIARYKD